MARSTANSRRLGGVKSAALACCLVLASRTNTIDAFVPSQLSLTASTRSSSNSHARPSIQQQHSALPESFSDVLSNPEASLSSIQSMVSSELLQSSDKFTHLVSSLTSGEISPAALLSSIMSDPVVSDMLSQIATPWHLLSIGLFTMGAAVVALLAQPDDYVGVGAPYEPGTTTYSPAASEEFYASRPALVAKRILKLAGLTSAFNSGLIFDWLVLGKLLKDEEYKALRRAEPRRAKEALGLCTKLGPTFIKLGQALSIRTDIIPEAYALELRSLQDAVPPFDSGTAYEVLRKELGVRDLNEVFSELSKEPVASASIGQVYKGRLRSNGKEVAVKVQRPGILAEIALDLHVLRVLTPIQTTLQNAANGVKTSQEDIDAAIALVDEWGRGFVAETDYRLEAENTINFEKAMRERGLDAVCAPPVVEEYTRDKVLVTEWVDGTRLDSSQSPDVPRLCGVAINAYLTMLLDTGCLHCDPHPYVALSVIRRRSSFHALFVHIIHILSSHALFVPPPPRLSPALQQWQPPSYHRWQAMYSRLGNDPGSAK